MADKKLILDTLDLMANTISESVSTEKHPEKTHVDAIVAALRVKALEHAQCAMDILVGNAYAEAIIVLRAAYEAVVVALYLEQHSEQIDHYEAYHRMVEFRNLFEMHLNVMPILPAEEQGEYTAIMDRLRQDLLADLHFFKYYREDFLPEYLQDIRKVRSISNSAQFIPFGQIRAAVNFDNLDNDFFKEGFVMYNIGSQVAHSHLNVIKAMYIRPRGPHDLYTWGQTAEVIFMTFSHTYRQLIRNSYMSDVHLATIQKYESELSGYINEVFDEESSMRT